MYALRCRRLCNKRTFVVRIPNACFAPSYTSSNLKCKTNTGKRVITNAPILANCMQHFRTKPDRGVSILTTLFTFKTRYCEISNSLQH